VDGVLKEEVGLVHVGVSGFQEAFFGDIAGLDSAANAVSERCKEGHVHSTKKGSAGKAGPRTRKS